MARSDRSARRKANVLPFVPKAIPLALALCFSSGAYAALCTIGNWSPTGTDPSCAPADPGYFVDTVGASAETKCIPGQYQPSAGMSACLPADTGRFATGPGATSEQACLSGTFASATGQSACTLAPFGNFVSSGGATAPTQCSAGFYQPATGQSACSNPVPAGYFSLAGASAATQCIAGFFQSLIGQSSCNPADGGHFVGVPSATAEQPCLSGTFASATGQSLCTLAPQGSFVSAGAATAPTLCSAGFYQPSMGTSACSTPAPPGSFVGLAGQSAPSQCLPGSYQPATGQSACNPAGAGFFVSTYGATSETACASGTTSSPGATACSTIQYSLSVAKAGSGGGTVSSAPAGISCGGTCLASFDTGTGVALAATPDASSIFSGWSGACTGVTACNVTMDSAKSVTADFEPTTSIPRLGNISTRMEVLTGGNVMIGGFIIGGSTNKTVAITATGPSLAPFGISNFLANPTLTLVRSSDQSVIATNDDWQTDANASLLQASGFAPGNPLESGLYVNLPPGAYTAIVQGAGGAIGVSVIGVFEVDHPDVPLSNISTRGLVLTGGNVMIGGFIVQGSGPQTVAVTATGPSLAPFGISNFLANPSLTIVRSSDQSVIATNDDWQADPNAAQLQASGFAPGNALEPGLLLTLQPGAYTAIVQGVGGSTGVSVIGVFTVP